MIDFAQAGAPGFSMTVIPSQAGDARFSDLGDANAYALAISGDDVALSKGRHHCGCAEEPGGAVVKTRSEVLGNAIDESDGATGALGVVNKVHEDIVLSSNDVVWISRIVWVSQ